MVIVIDLNNYFNFKCKQMFNVSCMIYCIPMSMLKIYLVYQFTETKRPVLMLGKYVIVINISMYLYILFIKIIIHSKFITVMGTFLANMDLTLFSISLVKFK